MARPDVYRNRGNCMDFSSREFNFESVRAELRERGVAVVTNVISAADCDRHVTQIRDWLANTFGDDGFPRNINSVIHDYGIAHLEPAWRVRLATRAVFAGIWGTEKLLTSTDGMAIAKPPEEGGGDFGDPSDIKGLHFDQGPHREGLHAYQGAVYLEEATETDWCFAVMEGSHNHHFAFFKHHKSGRSEFRRLNEKEVTYLRRRGCTVMRVPVPKGALVLWDSRTVHAGAPPIFGRPDADRWRFVVFVSQTPAIWARPEDIAAKHEAYFRLRCSRHWSSYGASNFQGRSDNRRDLTELPEVAKSLEARRLAGVEPYEFGDGLPNGPAFSQTKGAVLR